MPKRPDTINTTVSSAGTQQQIGTSGGGPVVEEAIFRPNVGNSGIIYIGAADVSSTNGFPLKDGDSLKIKNPDGEPVDLSLWWIDTDTSGEGGVTLFMKDD